MKNLTKVLALVLAFSMIIGVLAFAKEYTDIDSGVNYEEAVDVLSDLGLIVGYEDGTFGAEKTLTRAEGTAFVIRLMGLEEAAQAAEGQKTGYTDVPASHWASGYVKIATDFGVVEGNGDGTFEPDYNLTYAQIVKMIVVALGYAPAVAEAGTWPTNYLSVATQIKLTSGIPGSADEEVDRGTTARLLYAALTIPKMVKCGVGVNATYEPGDTMILDDLGFFKVKGAVTELSLIDDKAVVKAEAQCFSRVGSSKNAVGKYGDYSYENNSSDWTINHTRDNIKIKALGGFGQELKNNMEVPAIFFIKDDDDYTLASFILQTKVVDTVEFNSSDVNDKKSEGIKVVCFTNEEHTKTMSFKFNNEVNVYLNGNKYEYEYDGQKGDFFSDEVKEGLYEKFFNGTDKFSLSAKDTDGDGKYDMLVVTEYVYMVVKSVKTTNSGKYTIKSETGSALLGTLVIDTDNDDTAITIFRNGKEIDVDDIDEGDILNIVGNEWSDKELIEGTVYVTDDTFDGVVKYNDDDESEVTFSDGSTYGYILPADEEGLQSGDEATYYININGDIIFVSDASVKANLKIGFVTSIELRGSKTEFTSGSMRVLGTDGRWSTLDLNKKVNGISLDETCAIDFSGKEQDSVKVLDVDATCVDVESKEATFVLNRVIGYETNASGAVKTIITASKDIVTSKDNGFAKFTNKEFDDGEISGYYVTDETAIFSLTKGKLAEAMTAGHVKELSENYIKVTDRSVLKDGKDYSCTAYDIDEDDEISVLCGEFEAEVDFESNLMVVTKVVKTTDDDDNSILSIRGFRDGEDVEYTFSDDEDESLLLELDFEKVAPSGKEYSGVDEVKSVISKYGEVIFVNTDSKGVITKAMLVGENETELKYRGFSKGTTGGDDDGRLVAAFVEAYKNRKVYLTNSPVYEEPNEIVSTDYISANDNAKITVYDCDKEEAYEGDTSDIDYNAFIFARLNENDKIVEAVVFTNIDLRRKDD